MAFWGIEVKPGKPITHSCEKARGRLRISQATLGIGEASKKTIVQCNVGNRSPVLLCALLPNKTESCHLDLEFEEADDAVFSVIGPRSVYLTGYYVRQNRQSNPHSDTESYGVDIENTQTDGSSYCSDDDIYEDSFIDDDGLQVSQRSPVLSSKGTDEVTLENDKPKGGKGRGKQLKKKYRVIESDSDANSCENEDEDGFSKRAVKTTMPDAGEKTAQVTVEMDDEAKDDGVCGIESKQKVDPLDISGKLERVTKPPLDEEGTEVNNGKNELPKEAETLEELIVSNQDMVHGNNTKDTIINQNLPVSNRKDQMQSLDLAKPKKKRKERSMKEEKTSKVQTDKDHSVPREDKVHEVEASTNLGIGENYLVTPPELGSVDGQKSKKRRNELQLEGTLTEGIDEKCQNIPQEDIFKQGLLPSDSVTKDLPVANGECEEQQRLEETYTEGIGTKCHNMPREDEFMRDSHAESTTQDLPAASGEYQEQQIDKLALISNISIKSELLANDSQLDKKIKRKIKKTQGERDLNMGVIKMTDNQETIPMKYEDKNTNPVPIQKRTLSNGLIIEELATGPPDGKVAAPGKKVKIYYTAMLKESRHVFDSNVGKAAYKFRLGDQEYIDGWNVGIDGMHVGDKRRLIIPPSLGFGDHGVEENVPPNSWLVYDIELVGVRR